MVRDYGEATIPRASPYCGLPCLTLPHLALPCPALPGFCYDTLPYPASPHLTLPHPPLPCLTLPYPTTPPWFPCHLTPHRTLPCLPSPHLISRNGRCGRKTGWAYPSISSRMRSYGASGSALMAHVHRRMPHAHVLTSTCTCHGAFGSALTHPPLHQPSDPDPQRR